MDDRCSLICNYSVLIWCKIIKVANELANLQNLQVAYLWVISTIFTPECSEAKVKAPYCCDKVFHLSKYN